MTILDEASLEFAKAHIEAYYDSDFFPKRDEYLAIWSSWEDVKKHLRSTNVEKMRIEQPRSMPAPKARGGYRIVHQLEPLNALAYTALAYMVGPHVEAARAAKHVAFSYRLTMSSNSFFALGNGYQAFVDRCRELASVYSFVLAADVADFYNRLYLHRLENSLSLSGCPSGVGKALEAFLLALNGKASQGIPVGPAASIIMAEAVMTDVDQFLSNKAVPHARYVDDFRIFGNSKEALEILLEDLVQHLFNAHRLQFASGKTSVFETKSFVGLVAAPQETERRELLELVKAACEYGNQYTVDDVETLAKKYLAPTKGPAAPKTRAAGVLGKFFRLVEKHEQMERETVRDGVLQELLAEAMRSDPVDVGLARHALRQGRRWSTTALVEAVLANLGTLESVLPDALLYVNALCDDGVVEKHLDAFRAILSTATFRRSRFARHWTYWLLAGHAKLVTDPTLGQKMWNDAPVEWQLRAARTVRNIAKVREYKASVGDLGMWDRRALLMASEVMPVQERGPWLASVSMRDAVEQAIIQWAKSQP